MRKLVVTLVVLVLLLLAADRITVAVTQRLLASKMQSAGQLANTPRVRINGFPFLTQAIRGRYSRIDVQATGIRRDGVTVSRLDVHVIDAQVPLGDALSGSVTTVPVQALNATAVLSYLDLASDSQRAGVTVKPDGNLVDVVGRVKLLGQTFTARATSTITLQGSSLRVAAKKITVLGVRSSLLDKLADGLLDFTVNVPVLPYGLRLTGAHAEPQGVVLTARTGPTVLTP